MFTVFLIDNVASVQRVIQAAPTRVACVYCEACVVNRNDKLRPRDFRDLRIHSRGFDRKSLAFFAQVANFVEKVDVV